MHPLRDRRLKLISVGLATAVVTALIAAVAGFSATSAEPPVTLNVNGKTVKVTPNPALHALLPANIQSAGAINVATDPESPPYEFYAKDNKTIVGADISLAQAIGAVLGVNMNFTAIAFPGIIAAIQAGRFDMSISSMGDTPARELQINFVPYSTDGNAIIVRNGNPKNIKSIADLCGKTVGVLRGSVMEGLVDAQQPKCKTKIKLQIYPDQNTANLAVKSGRADATMTMVSTAAYIAQQTKDKSLQTLVFHVYGQGYNAIGVPKDDVALLLCVQQALTRLMASGAYLQILTAWNMEAGAIKTSLVNDGARFAQPTG